MFKTIFSFMLFYHSSNKHSSLRKNTMARTDEQHEEFVNSFLPLYVGSMDEFDRLRGKMHWTTQYAMAAKTVMSLKPVVAEILERWKPDSGTSVDITAGQLLYGVSATIHSGDFAAMSTQEKRNCLLAFVRKVLS